MPPYLLSIKADDSCPVRSQLPPPSWRLFTGRDHDRAQPTCSSREEPRGKENSSSEDPHSQCDHALSPLLRPVNQAEGQEMEHSSELPHRVYITVWWEDVKQMMTWAVVVETYAMKNKPQ